MRRMLFGSMMVLAIAVMAAGCSRRPEERTWLSMATFASVSTASDDSDRIEQAGALVSEEFNRLEGLWSDYKTNSDISRLNQSEGMPLKVHDDARLIIQQSCDYSRRTDGCFDATVGPLVDLWAIGSGKEFAIPDHKAISNALHLCGWDKIEIGDDGAVKFGVKGMRFDPGGVGKGLAVDMAAEILAKSGFKDHMVNLGGNIRCFGFSNRGQPWRVGVRDPFDQSRLLGALELTDGLAVATSGNYERYVEHDGSRYTHIMDPRTGRPVMGMAGVTVVAPTAADADVLSTALFVSGIDKGLAMLKNFSGAEAIFVPDIRPIELHVTAGMLKYFKHDDDIIVKVIADKKLQ